MFGNLLKKNTQPERSWGQSYRGPQDIASIQAAYEKDGAMLISDFFPPEDLNMMTDGWKNIKTAIEKDHSLERNARFVSGVLPAPAGEIYRHPKMVELAQLLLGTKDMALYMNRILVKDKEWNGTITVHQDMPYFHGGAKKLSIFVPLAPIQADGGNGGLKYLLGSHHYGMIGRGTIQIDQFPKMEQLAPNVVPGDIVLMDFMTWHYSENAVTNDDRPLMQIVYQPATDGSYGNKVCGMGGKPTLVCGEWRTQHFIEREHGIMAD